MEMRDCLIVISIFLSVFSAPSFLWSAGSAQENGFPRQETLLNSRQLGRAMEMHLQENSMYLWSQNVHTSPTTQTQALGFLSISKAPKPPTRKAKKKKRMCFLYPSYGERVERSIFRREQAIDFEKNEFTTRDPRMPGMRGMPRC